MSYVHIFLRPPIIFLGILWKKYSLEAFFYNRQIPWSYFGENDNMKICFETPQKIKQLTTMFR